MALVSSRSLKTRSLRGRTRLFWAFAIPAIAVTITVNLSVLDGGVDLTSESDIREAIPSIDHDTSLPLINLLSHARMSISRKDMESIPKWSEVVSRFGERPRILGLETCSTFRGLNPQKDLRLIAPAGIFNSGTNLLYRLLAKNCKTSDFNQNSYSRTGIDWQVNWGKHQSPRFRFENSVKENRNISAVLPVVVVRDPWTWLQSMCVQNYAAIWYHVLGPEGHCPNLVPSHVEHEWFYKGRFEVARYFHYDIPKVRNVMLKANFTLDMKTIPLNVRYRNEVARHESLVHFWEAWYHEYYQAEFPRLIIRLEDLVFHPYKTLQSICDCVEGNMTSEKEFTLLAESVKNYSDPAHSKTRKTDLLSSFFLHLRSNRTSGMTLEDVVFSKNFLADSRVRQFFGYQPPSPADRVDTQSNMLHF